MGDYRGIAPMDMSGNVSENWKFWIQKFKNYLKATELDTKKEDLQCAQLLQFIGDEGIRIFNTFKFTDTEIDKLAPLIKKFQDYFQPKKNLTFERYKFINRKQIDGEGVQQFVTDLKNKAKNCDLGSLEESLTCSVFISGLLCANLKQRLLEDDDITLNKAVRVSLSVEESRKQEKVMTDEKSHEVNVIQNRVGGNQFRRFQGRQGSSMFQNQRMGLPSTSGQQFRQQNNNTSKMDTICYRCGFQLHLRGQLCPATEPVPVNKAFNFEDNWNYEIQPHDVPLLREPRERHSLPANYEYEQDLNVVSLEDVNDKVRARAPKKLIGENVVRQRVPCGICKLGVGLLEKEVRRGTSFGDIKLKFVSLCVTFKIESEQVCSGFFDVFGPELLPAYNASKLAPSATCSLIFGETCGNVENTNHEWNIQLPAKTNSTPIRNEIQKMDLPTYKVLHLSDNHLDPAYAVGAPANCEEPLCCRNYSTPSAKESTVLSGRWGAYNKCDSPRNLIENMLKNIALEHTDIDYIIWTGDLPPHDIWNQTKEYNLNIIKETVRQMFEYFPDTPIFPAIGNHESVPAGSFAPPWMRDENHSIDWLYTTLADQWRRWLPPKSGNTVLHGGFYSVLLRPGFRLISLNTNYCHTLSWWLLVNSTDPAKELKWLVHELQSAEKNQEKVHLIGHIPPGSSDCMKTWSRNYYAIIERYQDTIVAQFFGHSHADEYEVFYETAEYSTPIAVAYLGPSVTTYENFNPAYRIYYVDGDRENSTREVLDHETWTMDLDLANKDNNNPLWYKLYSAKDAYAMSSLRPAEWNNLIKKMLGDNDLWDTFYKNYYRDSPTRPFCDSQCKIQILCDLKSGKSQDRRHLCHDLQFD